VARYIMNRFLQLIPTLFLVSLAIFVAMQIAPGDPAMMRMGTEAALQENQEALEQLRKEMGLDKPVPVQYFIWVSNVLRGDFGLSNRSGVPVLQMIAGRLPATIELTIAAFLFALLTSIPLGMLAALKQKTWFDNGITGFAVIGLAIPSLWLGLVLILVFSVMLKWLPASGYTPLFENPADNLKRLIMPAFTLGVFLVASFTRFLRSDMIEVLNEDYIRTAISKGVNNRTIVWKHALRNAFIPLMTVMGVELGALLGGTVIIETVFGWSGLGWLTLQAVYNRDYPLVQGCVVVAALFKVVINFLVDISYAYLNPRIREQYEG
jgi:peptide/nickel transport system permease protein